MRHETLVAAALVACLSPAEPAPRTLQGRRVPVATPLAHITAAYELPGGRILITNGSGPAVLLVDPVSGAVSPVGSAGAGPEEYARPGGLYTGANGTIQLLDRGRARVLDISPSGAITGSRSIAVRGTRVASDADIDLQRPDARGSVYFVRRALFNAGETHATLVRFDPDTQEQAEVARLRTPESRASAGGDGIVIRRTVIGSPADGWAVAPDGRVAIVRADPYRVEWVLPDGRSVQGPDIAVDPIPFTDADRRAHAASRSGGPSVGRAGGTAIDLAGLDLVFAPTKAPFLPDGVLVSREGHVWVMRTRPFGVREVIYDVFERRGRRIDRIQFSADSRVVGFGPGSVLVRRDDGLGRQSLMRYPYTPK